jgi:adenosine deaminase CECR1
MVGDTRMTIHGWKQLALWSIKHSCLSPDEQKQATDIFMKDWEAFCEEVVKLYQADAAKICDVCYKLKGPEGDSKYCSDPNHLSKKS